MKRQHYAIDHIGIAVLDIGKASEDYKKLFGYSIHSEETLEHLSAVRLGVQLGLLDPGVSVDVVNELFIITQPAHLQRLTTGPMEAKERDVARADLIRKRLGTTT